MKKLGKILMWFVIVVVALLLVVVLTLPLTIGPIVKTAASVGGPKALGVPVSLGDVKLNPLAGNLTVLRFKVGNPQGYSDKDAFAVDKVEVGLNMRSLLSDTIVVRKIQIDAPAISFESKEGKSNFDTMMANVKKSSAEEKDKAKAPEGEKKPGKKVIIEEFTLNNGQVAFTSGLTLGKGITLPLPSITVRDIGKESGGASAVEALTEVMNSVLGGLSKAVSGAASAAGDLLKGAGDAVSGAAKGATDALKGAASGAADAAKGVTDTLKGATSGATDAAKGVTDTLKGATSGATDAAKGVTDTLKGVTSGATDAAKGATSGTTGTADDAVKTAEGTVKGAADAAKATTDKLKKLNPFGK
jgi:uncharacterized protein involved in outer membrane biogenesis